MSKPFPERPPVDPPDTLSGPGPLSPAWPWVVVPVLPEGRLERIAARLTLLKDECYVALAQKGAPFLLGLRQREELAEMLEEVRGFNTHLPRHLRSRRIEAWPVPVLPAGILFGARDLLPLLDAAASTATVAADAFARDARQAAYA
jgi:hypothetical protein